ncbi:MAG: hypothetical protein WC773_04510 [Patescibacteria group bacterium]|jgi:hypothetical protein
MAFDIENLPLEDELRIFEDFVRSPGWIVAKARWQPLLSTAIGAALSGKAGAERDFLAGKANAIKNFIEYPEKHIRNLQIKLKNEEAKAKSK